MIHTKQKKKDEDVITMTSCKLDEDGSWMQFEE
jgi:hypothetical protein